MDFSDPSRVTGAGAKESESQPAQRNLFSTAELIFVNHIIQINKPKRQL